MTSFAKLFSHDQFCKTCLMDQCWEQFFQESPACDFQVGPGSRESARDRSNCDRQHCLWQQILPRSYSQQVGVGSCFLSPLLVTGTWWCLTWWGRWRPTTWREGGELGAVKAAAPSAWNILHKSQKICLNPSRGRVKSLLSIFLWPTGVLVYGRVDFGVATPKTPRCSDHTKTHLSMVFSWQQATIQCWQPENFCEQMIRCVEKMERSVGSSEVNQT